MLFCSLFELLQQAMMLMMIDLTDWRMQSLCL
jgi:hypothetical protein